MRSEAQGDRCQGVQVGDQAADLRLRRCARLREPRRRDRARQRQVRSDVCEEVVPHAWVRRRVERGVQLGKRRVLCHRDLEEVGGEAGRTKAWASGARPFKA